VNSTYFVQGLELGFETCSGIGSIYNPLSRGVEIDSRSLVSAKIEVSKALFLC
jgi:hypothetical protein